MTGTHDVDVLVIGACFAGLRTLHIMRERAVAVLEAGDGVGRSDTGTAIPGPAATSRATTTRRGSEPGEAVAARVRAYFEPNATARLAMAYYYQEFILALPTPQTVPMMNVITALDLSGEGAVPTNSPTAC